MRPKSIATVVSLLRLRVASVICRSVDRTVISLMVRIRVVFPAANGPVTTIFTAVPDPRQRLRVVRLTLWEERFRTLWGHGYRLRRHCRAGARRDVRHFGVRPWASRHRFVDNGIGLQ